MKSFIRKMFLRLPSNEKRRKQRRVKAYEIMLEHQVCELSAKLQELQDNKNDMFAHMRRVSSLQHQFIEACQLEHQYADFVAVVQAKKEGAAV
jgi:response regulator RpfG family c-di-GMP phosphodiesterase